MPSDEHMETKVQSLVQGALVLGLGVATSSLDDVASRCTNGIQGVELSN